MSMNIHWHSTLFAWNHLVSVLTASVSLLIILSYCVDDKKNEKIITNSFYDNLRKYLFAFSIFWVYLWYSNDMLTWYSNLPGEISFFQKFQQEHYRIVNGLNLVMNFFVPFGLLLFNRLNRIKQVLFFVSLTVFIGHLADLYLAMIPSIEGYSVLWFQEVIFIVGFMVYFLFILFILFKKNNKKGLDARKSSNTLVINVERT